MVAGPDIEIAQEDARLPLLEYPSELEAGFQPRSAGVG